MSRCTVIRWHRTFVRELATYVNAAVIFFRILFDGWISGEGGKLAVKPRIVPPSQI